jgi:acyl carrier protein
MPASWTEMRRRLLTRVFYDRAPGEVEASTDLVGEGFLNSMSILVLLGLLDDELGEGIALTEVTAADTTSVAALEALYLRLLGDRQTDVVS